MPIANAEPHLDRCISTNDAAELTGVELAHLRARLVALENVVIVLLALSSDERLEAAAAMATFLLPREGFTNHEITIDAARQINHLISQATRWRAASGSVAEAIVDPRAVDPSP